MIFLRLPSTTLFITAVLAIVFFVPLSPSPLSAQDENGNSEELTESEQLLRSQLRSPRATFGTFFKAMEDGNLSLARSCLQPSSTGRDIAEAKGNVHADRLYQVLNKLWDRSLWNVPGDPETESPFILDNASFAPPKRADLNQIQLVRNGRGMWVFSTATLTAVDESLWDTWSDPEQASLSFAVWLEQNLPQSLRDRGFLLKNYQWLCLVALILAGFIIGFVVRLILDFLTSLYFRIRNADVDTRQKSKLWKPVSLFAHAATWYYGAKLFDLPIGLQRVLFTGFQILAVVSLVWTAYRAADLLLNYLHKRAALSEGRYDDTLSPIIASVFKIAATIIGLVVLVNLLGWEDWSTLLGGLGVGGIAVAIAAKDMIGNVFGSFTVLTDRPFEIGDWVVIDGKVEGTVEKVGMRSSRIRTFHQSQMIVPNNVLTTSIVDNMGRRDYRRFKTDLKLSCGTNNSQLECFCAAIRQLLEDNTEVLDENLHVYVNNFGDSSIDVLINCFFDCNSWETELRLKHEILLNFIAIAEKLNIRFAYPTQSIELTNVSGEKQNESESTNRLQAMTLKELQAYGQEVSKQVSSGSPKSDIR